MMDLVFREHARADLRNAMAWFRDQNDGSETRFEAELEAELLFIRQFPNGYQVRRPPFRFGMVARFSFFVIYTLDVETVVVHRIRHMHQRPLKRYFGKE